MSRAGEVGQQLGALARDWSLVPNTNTKQLTTTLSLELQGISCLLLAYSGTTCTQADKPIGINKTKNKSKNKTYLCSLDSTLLGIVCSRESDTVWGM